MLWLPEPSPEAAAVPLRSRSESAMTFDAASSLEALPDADLVARIAAGDEDAFAAAYDRHSAIVYGSTVRFLQDRELAEEVVQDAFVGLWRHAAEYDASTGTLVGWLLAIARNRAIDRQRSINRRPREAAPGDNAEIDTLVQHHGVDRAAADTPETTVLRSWIRAVVRTSLSVMPETERLTLGLAYDEGLSQAEIAERTGWPIGTVKTRTRRALANLRMALERVPDLHETAGVRSMGGHRGAR